MVIPNKRFFLRPDLLEMKGRGRICFLKTPKHSPAKRKCLQRLLASYQKFAIKVEFNLNIPGILEKENLVEKALL